jgi:redox-sensitive bicupin YhaK (pirin superfamily)
MKTKNIEKVFAPKTPHFVGDGFRVHNYIPSRTPLSMQRMDPFIMLDYNEKFYFPPSEKPRGVGVHPHRGFETVTIAYKGKIAHHDSAGNSDVIAEGDVQWMTASAGILHKEYHEKNFSHKGGDFQMVQLWVNLPAQYKMSPPKYQGLPNKNISKVTLPQNAGTVEVIAGEYQGTLGAASTFTPINLLNTHLNKNGKASFSFPANYNTALVIIEGKVTINNTEEVQPNHFVLFKNEGEEFTLETNEGAIVLVMSGKPIGEPIAAHGPFVMNNREELIQAFNDFNMGKFGYLED